MSSINRHPTFSYTQPNEYRFSHDSVFLAREVFEREHENFLKQKQLQVLDLCSGVGVVGLDFVFHTLKAAPQYFCKVDFLEVQSLYQCYFDKNVIELRKKFLSSQMELSFLNLNYENAQIEKKYDLIICNPPYFDPARGKMSPSFFKNRCRFFIDGTLTGLLIFMQMHLAQNGRAYFLIREEMKPFIPEQFLPSLYFPLKVRGTWVGLMSST